MNNQSQARIESRVNEFKAAENSESGARKFVEDMQRDARQAGSWSRLANTELNPMNEKLHDSLPKVEITGSKQELKIMGLTAEHGHKNGIVLATEGEGNRVIILTNQGKYVEAQKTEDGYVAKKGGKEFTKSADGTLTEQKRLSDVTLEYAKRAITDPNVLSPGEIMARRAQGIIKD